MNVHGRREIEIENRVTVVARLAGKLSRDPRIRILTVVRNLIFSAQINPEYVRFDIACGRTGSDGIMFDRRLRQKRHVAVRTT